MASYVVINIDTTSPNINIYAPSYTTVDMLNEITIQADEELSLDFYEIYAIDSNGTRYDYDFLYETDKFIGHVKFAGFPVGSIITLYARVMDKVGNVSSLISKSIHIADTITLLTLDISDRIADVQISDRSMKIESSDRSEQIGTK